MTRMTLFGGKLLIVLIYLFQLVTAAPAVNPNITKSGHGNTSGKLVMQPSKFIIGGQPVQFPSQWPWQVKILYAASDGYAYMCGGTLIDQMHVLTAAHCVEDMQLGRNTFVKMGLVNSGIETTEQDPLIAKFTAHPRYDKKTLYADIAILTLDRAMTYTTSVDHVTLCQNDTDILERTDRALVTGWGVYDVNHPNASSKRLLQAWIPLIDSDKCQKRWFDIIIDETVICAGARGRGTGPGDSGGPLMAKDENGNYVQIGITSFGINEGEGLYDQNLDPGVYTRVSHYYDFIQCVINDRTGCRAAQTAYLLPLLFSILYSALLN